MLLEFECRELDDDNTPLLFGDNVEAGSKRVGAWIRGRSKYLTLSTLELRLVTLLYELMLLVELLLLKLALGLFVLLSNPALNLAKSKATRFAGLYGLFRTLKILLILNSLKKSILKLNFLFYWNLA